MRLLTAANLRWVVRHRAWTPYYLKRYWRFAWFKVRHPQVVTEGFVFLGKKLEIVARPGHGRLILGKWVHLGDETRLRAHEGTLRIGDKVVFARDVTVNCYLDIEIGASTLIADTTYICDFDHKTEDLDLPIKDQGLVKSPVRIGPDCWLATKVTVTRGADIGRGAVIGANSVARGNIPAYSVAVGIPAVVVRDRQTRYEADAPRRAYLAELAHSNAQTTAHLQAGNTPTPAPPATAPPTRPAVAPLTPPATGPLTPPAVASPTPPAVASPTPPVVASPTPPVVASPTPPAVAPPIPPVVAPPTPPAVAPLTPPAVASLAPPAGVGPPARPTAAAAAVGRASVARLPAVFSVEETADDASTGDDPGTTGERADATRGFSSYSPVGHYVPEAVEEETQRG